MKTLHLNLKRQWYDMILSGEKKEEYREIKQYWIDRLVAAIWSSEFSQLSHEDRIRHHLGEDKIQFEIFDTITFSNGYSKDRDSFVIELKSIEIKEGNSKWGAIPGEKYFCLQLGEVLFTNTK